MKSERRSFIAEFKAKIGLLTILLLTIVFLLCNHHFQLCAFTPFSTSTEKSLCVMTWNIHVYDPAFKEKQTDIANEILEQDADIVLINEFSWNIAVQLHSQLKEKYPYVTEKYKNVLGENILYSRYPIDSCQRLETPIQHSHVYEFRLKVDEKPMRIVGCHLFSSNDIDKTHRYTLKNKHDILDLPDYYANYKKAMEIRTRQAELIRSCLLSEDLPTIVMGDMNDFSGTSPLNTLQKVGLKDAWWEGGNGFGITFHEDWMHFRLDHILYDANWKLSSVKVVQSDLSDHLPLVAEFSMKY